VKLIRNGEGFLLGGGGGQVGGVISDTGADFKMHSRIDLKFFHRHFMAVWPCI
jgi:hypothetical protein